MNRATFTRIEQMEADKTDLVISLKSLPVLIPGMLAAYLKSGGPLVPIQNNSPPLFAHINGTLPVFGKRVWLGASYFDGNSYPSDPDTGDVNISTLVYKRRFALATSFKL